MSVRLLKAEEVEALLSVEATLEKAKLKAVAIIKNANMQAAGIIENAKVTATQIRLKVADDERNRLDAAYAAAQMDWIAEQHRRTNLAEAESLLAFEVLVLDALRAILPGLDPNELVAGVMPHFRGRLKRGNNATIEVHANQVDQLGTHASYILEAAGMIVDIVVAPEDSPTDTLIVGVPTGRYDLTPSRQIDKIHARWSAMSEALSFGK